MVFRAPGSESLVSRDVLVNSPQEEKLTVVILRKIVIGNGGGLLIVAFPPLPANLFQCDVMAIVMTRTYQCTSNSNETSEH